MASNFFKVCSFPGIEQTDRLTARDIFFTFINLMFICIYMNILIYNQERKECTMQKKIFIYKSINKQRHTQFCILNGFCVLGESRKSKTKPKRKRLQLEKVWKLFVRLKNGTRHNFEGTKGRKSTSHTYTTTPAGFQFGAIFL